MRLKLDNREWLIGERIGDDSGFAEVFRATAEDGTSAAVKFIPKGNGAAQRELLFTNVNARNVVPVIDKGETAAWPFAKGQTDDAWVIAMPLAEKSLAAHLKSSGGVLPLAEAVTILLDIALALSDLGSEVVHRDLKPANVLCLEGRWCLADFGLARYAAAATATITWKGAGTPLYQAPEVWTLDHATVATDVYSFGVIAFELLSGRLPFPGPTWEDLRRQHLYEAPPALQGVPPILAALVEECLQKSPEVRLTPAEVLDRLTRAGGPAPTGGRAALEQANLAEVLRRADAGQRASAFRTEQQRREQLFTASEAALARISETFLQEITSLAPAGTVERPDGGGWIFTLGLVKLIFTFARPAFHDWAAGSSPPFDVVAYAAVQLRVPDYHPGPHPAFANPSGVGMYGYKGRAHSLWFCNVRGERYRWYETAFMTSSMILQHPLTEPYALIPDARARLAFGDTTGPDQVAVPFTPLDATDLGTFVDRWATWLAAAFDGTLTFPGQLPEPGADGSWR
ncbi:serine/threonine protein kinase [Kitasatospora sp. NBC_01560]|uniref:serine/threonine-protein kinase n=1 Tax=Kitasatospora sp. NBC_01560 TaxID=2975965 RepID=UPI00386483A1